MVQHYVVAAHHRDVVVDTLSPAHVADQDIVGPFDAQNTAPHHDSAARRGLSRQVDVRVLLA
jgi:hypothetical protein